MSDLTKYVAQLTDELGARPANTEEEYVAASEIENIMKQRGLETVIQEFPVPVFSGFATNVLYACMVLLALLSHIHWIVGLICLLLSIVCLALYGLEFTGKGLISRLSFNGTSQNVIGRHPGTAAAPGRRPKPVIIIANYDSPKVDLLRNPKLASLSPYLHIVNLACMIAIPVLLLLKSLSFMVNLTNVFWVLALIAAVPLLIHAVCGLLQHFSLGYVQGANDNASGVAAMLGVLERVRPQGGYALSDASYDGDYEDEYADEYADEYLDGAYADEYADDTYESDEAYGAEAHEEYTDERGGDQHDAGRLIDRRPANRRSADEHHDVSVSDKGAAQMTKRAKKAVRRGAGVARAAGIIPENVKLVYLDQDSDFAPAEQLDNADSTDKKQGFASGSQGQDKMGLDKAEAELLEQEQEQEQEQGYNPRKEQERRQAAAQQQKSSKPAETLRSRFADLPIDYKREKTQNKVIAASTAGAATAAGASSAVSAAAGTTANTASSTAASAAATAERPGLTAETKAKTETKTEAAINTSSKMNSEPEEAFEPVLKEVLSEGLQQEELQLPEYDAKSAVDAARKSGRIKDEPLPELILSEPKAQDTISLVGIKDTKQQLDDSYQDLVYQDESGYQDGLAQQEPMDDWGQSSYRPNRKAKLLDLPDPSVSAVDPYSVADLQPVGDFNPDDFPADEFETGTFVAQPAEQDQGLSPQDYEIDMPKENAFRRFGDKIGSLFSRSDKSSRAQASRSRAGSRSRRAQEEESLSDWLGVDEGFDAKKDGRKIGSWDNFSDEDRSWRGGGTYIPAADEAVDTGQENWDEQGIFDEDAEPMELVDRREVREAIMAMDDSDLTSHEIWFVATGASSHDHAGVKAFLQEYKNELRGAFVIHLRAVGSGKLTLITKEGAYARRNADRRLVNLMRRVGKDLARPLDTAELSWTDTEASTFLRAGFRGLSLMGLTKGVPALSSWTGDTADKLDEEQIASAVDIITETIRRS